MLHKQKPSKSPVILHVWTIADLGFSFDFGGKLRVFKWIFKVQTHDFYWIFGTGCKIFILVLEAHH